MNFAPISQASTAIQIHLAASVIAIGGLLITGGLSFMPGRTLYHVFLARVWG
jgi:uncharacterized membrane protein